VNRKPDDDRDDHEERDQAADAREERSDQHPLPRMPNPSARKGRPPVASAVVGRGRHAAHWATSAQ
jgi:hypothetical protein